VSKSSSNEAISELAYLSASILSPIRRRSFDEANTMNIFNLKVYFKNLTQKIKSYFLIFAIILVLINMDITIDGNIIFAIILVLSKYYFKDIYNYLKVFFNDLTKKTEVNQDLRPDAKYQIFLSYPWAIQDNVKILNKKLNDSGLTTWLDIKRLVPGQRLLRTLAENISKSEVFMCCLTKEFANSKNCQDEICYARNQERYIIPIMFEKIEMSDLGDAGVIVNPLLRVNLYEDNPFVFEGDQFETLKKGLVIIFKRLKLKSYCLEKKKALTEDEKLAEKISADDKKKINDACDEALRWLDEIPSAKVEELEHKLIEVENICSSILTMVYQSGGGSGAGAAPSGMPSGHYPGSKKEEVDKQD